LVIQNKMPRYRREGGPRDGAMPLYISIRVEFHNGFSATARISCWSLSADLSKFFLGF